MTPHFREPEAREDLNLLSQGLGPIQRPHLASSILHLRTGNDLRNILLTAHFTEEKTEAGLENCLRSFLKNSQANDGCSQPMNSPHEP